MLKIGISACLFHPDHLRPIFKGKTLLYVEKSLVQWIHTQNAFAFLIPTLDLDLGSRMRDYAQEMDALVLQGGSDLAPESYGEVPIFPHFPGDAIRDAYEIELYKEFIAQRKPVLGICRGAQLINVAHNGTLYQDISTQIPHALLHRDPDIYDGNIHSIVFEPASVLRQMYRGVTKPKINSIHHQGIKEIGKNLVVEAHSPDDGMIEAIRLNDPDLFVLGVQWHPEFHDIHSNTQADLLDSLVLLRYFLEEVRKQRKRRTQP